MKLIIDMGRVIQISDQNYRRLLRSIMDGRRLSLQELGAKVLGSVECVTTEMGPWDAATFLDLDIRSRKKKRGEG